MLKPHGWTNHEQETDQDSYAVVAIILLNGLATAVIWLFLWLLT